MVSQKPWPLMPPKSTELRMSHFDETVYNVGTSTVLFRFLDALCGDAGAGSLKKAVFLQRLSGALDNIYGADLDYVFGNMRFLSRAGSESYPYNPATEQLTSAQWDEVEVKDAQYRARIREYFIACGSGATTDSIRQTVHAATSADCQVMETWKYIDDFGISEPLGRAFGSSWVAVDLTTGHRVPFNTAGAASAFVGSRPNWQVQRVRSRSEITVVPHKQSLTARETRLLVQMLDRLRGVDTVVTVNPQGLSVHAPVPVAAITADSTYFQVEKTVTGAPILNELPPPELLAADLDPSQSWLKANTPELAPYARFNITSESGYYYLMSGGKQSPIDEVSYGVLQDDGSVRPEPAFEWFEQSEQFGPWTDYERADSPDNFPGGKYGLTPARGPALNPDRSPYVFAYPSQADYLAAKQSEVLALGGQVTDVRYRLPAQKPKVSKRTYTPDLAIAYSAPVRESTVTSSWATTQPRFFGVEQRNPSLFVRS